MINLHRRGTMHGFWTPDSPPTIPASYPLPAALRRTMNAADKAESDIAEAVQSWEQAHAAMATPPRPAEDAAEDAAWYHLADVLTPAVAAIEKAQVEFRAWLTDHAADAASWEVSRLKVWRKAEAEAQTARDLADRAAHDVGETWRLSQNYVLARYDHGDKPRGIRTGTDASNARHIERVEAYWTGLAEGGDESAPLPGDTVAPPFTRRRVVVR